MTGSDRETLVTPTNPLCLESVLSCSSPIIIQMRAVPCRGNPDPNVTIDTNMSVPLRRPGHGSIHSCRPHIYMIPRNPGKPVMGHTIYAMSIFSKRPFLQGPYQQWLTSFVRCPPQCPGAAGGEEGLSIPSLDPGSWGPIRVLGGSDVPRGVSFGPVCTHRLSPEIFPDLKKGAP